MAFGGSILTWFDGRWHDGNPPIMRRRRPRHLAGHAGLRRRPRLRGRDPRPRPALRPAHPLGRGDGPRAAGRRPRRSRRWSARASAGSAATAPLYLRPMMWSREALAGAHRRAPRSRPPSPSASRSCRSARPARWRSPSRRSAARSPDAALCEAKAACHYPNNARIVREARARGFQNALSLDQEGHVAETASTNVFLVRDGVVMTPAANGTFLNGITRQRVIRAPARRRRRGRRGDARPSPTSPPPTRSS